MKILQIQVRWVYTHGVKALERAEQKAAQINNVETLISTIKTHPADQPLAFSVTQDGMTHVLPEVLIQIIKENPMARMMNPQADLSATRFEVDPADQGIIKGTITIKAGLWNVTAEAEFKNSPNGTDLIPSSIKVSPTNLQQIVEDNLKTHPINEALLKYLQRILEEKGIKRQLQKICLHINPQTQTLDGEIT